MSSVVLPNFVLKRTVIREIEADAKSHGDERRTLIEAQKRAVAEVRIVDEYTTNLNIQNGVVPSTAYTSATGNVPKVTVKGVEIGDGFATAAMSGVENADEMRMGNDGNAGQGRQRHQHAASPQCPGYLHAAVSLQDTTPNSPPGI